VTPRLSRRQVEIIGLLAEGGTSKTVGAKLGISPRTVDTHVRVIMLKLGAASRTHAVGLWLQNWRDR
jgi:DNA-binding CsgD family transcriptional regulator